MAGCFSSVPTLTSATQVLYHVYNLLNIIPMYIMGNANNLAACIPSWEFHDDDHNSTKLIVT